ncbi:hypothetical protein LINPERPRIM_LOCUS14903 [Linum perenne]
MKAGRRGRSAGMEARRRGMVNEGYSCVGEENDCREEREEEEEKKKKMATVG